MAPRPPNGYSHILDAHGNRLPLHSVYGDYEGATFGRRFGFWGTSTSGPNTEIFNSLSTLRSRSRELVRNNSIPSGGLDAFVANLIGTGITPRWQVEDRALKKRIQQLWADWTKEADADGVCSFYGLQTLIARSVVEGGEALVRFRPRRPRDNMTVPLQLQGMEPDFLDEYYTTQAPNGNQIRMSIEFNRIGKRTAYWMFVNHPGETYLPNHSVLRKRIPARQILHIYRPLRLGQIRGRPWLSSIILKLHELDQYEDAELVRKKAAAMFGGFITVPPVEDENNPYPPLGQLQGTDPNGRDVVAMEPGTFPELPPGMDVKFAEPADVGGSYEPWIKQQLRRIAKGMGVTYEQLTGDLTGVNYSSIRAGLIEARRLARQIQATVFIHQFCHPVAVFWMDQAVLSGALDIPDYWVNRLAYQRIKWMPDGWDWVDPVKDQQAEEDAVRSGFKPRAQVVAERTSRDIEDVDAEIAEDNARADSLGLVFDTDPRWTDRRGQGQRGSLEVGSEGE